MRRQLSKFLPVFLIALAGQILAPITTARIAAIATSDPLGAAEICVNPLSQTPAAGHRGADDRAYFSLCSICCAAEVGVGLDTPNHPPVYLPQRQPVRVDWHNSAGQRAVARTGSNAQARAPPFLF